MYSGSTLTNRSGNILGAHQKFIRVCRKALSEMIEDDNSFPSKRLLLNFEGKNGPDGMKSKSAGDDPWHFYDPLDPTDTKILNIINDHYEQLVAELRNQNTEKAAFEAAWLAHALVDGLTPAHHYPYEQEINNLHGNTKEERNSILKKIVAPGETKIQLLSKNWQIWGSKGLLMTHSMFELGTATIIMPLPGRIAYPGRYDIKNIERLGIIEYFKRHAADIASSKIYNDFYSKGWTLKLTKTVKNNLAPKMATMVTLAWYMAAKEAGLTGKM